MSACGKSVGETLKGFSDKFCLDANKNKSWLDYVRMGYCTPLRKETNRIVKHNSIKFTDKNINYIYDYTQKGQIMIFGV